MPILKAPPKLIRNSTIQVRVEEEIDLKLRKYAEFIGSTPAFVVAESLKMLFHKDTEFREWFSHHGDTPVSELTQMRDAQETHHTKPGPRTMFDEVPLKAANK
jgi:hypothetical protein